MYVCQLLFIENKSCIDAAHVQSVDLTSLAVTGKFHSSVEFLADLCTHRHDKAHAIVIILSLVCLSLSIRVAILQTQLLRIKAFQRGIGCIYGELDLEQELAFCLFHVCP